MPGFSLRRDDEEILQGIWTPYGPEPTAQERADGLVQEQYQIRALAPKNMDHFRTVAMKKRWEQHQRVEEPDPKRYDELLYDHLIEDWEGVYLDDAKKHPAPCTAENKYLLMKGSLDRQNFIILQGSLYANDDDARKSAQQANFRASHSTPARSSEPGLHSVSDAVFTG